METFTNNNNYIRGCDIPFDKVMTIEALPVVTEQWLHDLRRHTGILCFCKKTVLYYEAKIEKIAGNGTGKTFKVHYKNYGKKQDQVFSFLEARSWFLPHTVQTITYMKKHNKDIVSLICEISLQEREMIVEEDDNDDDDDDEEDDDEEEEDEHVIQVKPKKTLPEMNVHCVESLGTLREIDDNGKLMTYYPPRYCMEEIVKNFQESTKMFDYFNEVTMDFFCSSFESSYMFSSRQTDADYEKNAAFLHYMGCCRSRGIHSPTQEEIDIKTQIFGQWKPNLACRYIFGVTHLVRYLIFLYQQQYDLESVRTLNGKEEEILLLVTHFAHFINQNREQYFCEEKDYTRPIVNFLN
uniref:MRG domain-containing protein n=1 Tax=Panagrolaimus superbus TaxID=310955 RepID=A0A914Z092_9BILA